MFSHIILGTNGLDRAISFYDTVMPVLGYHRESTGPTFAGYGKKENIHTGKDCLWIGKPFNGEPATPGNGVNVALLAQSRKAVDSFIKRLLNLVESIMARRVLEKRGTPTFMPPIFVIPMETSRWLFSTKPNREILTDLN